MKYHLLVMASYAYRLPIYCNAKSATDAFATSTACWMEYGLLYDGPSVKEKLKKLHDHFYLEKIKGFFMFTTAFWGEKIKTHLITQHEQYFSITVMEL